MSDSRFDQVFARVIGAEGGYSNDPQDPGGETKFGISKRAYPDVDIPDLTLEDAKAIYLMDYWTRLGCGLLPAPVDEFLFDYGVNSGVEHAARALQRAVGVLPDGKVGPVTISAAKAKDPRAILRLLFVDRAWTFAHASALEHAGHGWFGRLFDKTERAIGELPHG